MENQKSDHFKKYQALAENIGIQRLAVLVPQPEKIAECLKKDEHLNNIPLHLWDKPHDVVKDLAKKYGLTTGWSIADTCCLLKHVARYYVAENQALAVPEVLTMEKFISRAGIQFEIFPTAANPTMPENMFHYTARLARMGIVMETPFSTGAGWKTKPTLSDVLDCLASDASYIENASDFESFCGDLGYDTDSRKAEKIYEAVKRNAEKIRLLLGPELFQILVYEMERL